MEKTLIIIPAYNCASVLTGLINRIKAQTDCDILIVDDGSKDNTQEILSSLQVLACRHEGNLGKGAALQTGFDFAREKAYINVITMDADGQHDPDDLGIFFKYDADMVLGKRTFRLGIMPVARIMSNIMTSLILSIITGKKVSDSQCGYRKIRLANLNSFHPRFSGFQYETEILLHILKRRKGSVVNVPIKTIYKDEKSNIRHFHDTFQFIAVVWRYLWISG